MSTTAVVTHEGGATGLRFVARTGSGHEVIFDSGPGQTGPNPVETMLAALGACEGMDVVGILRKKRQEVTDYELSLTCERQTEPPRSIKTVEILHRVRGSVSAVALEDAIRLSETKYCSVHHSLRTDIPITSRWEILPVAAGPEVAP
jgi:putative redox protein